jgi:DNA-binding transcriptional MerR regulator
MTLFPFPEILAMNQNEQLHSIQQVSTELNIPKPTLRFWEKEFDGLLQPLRTHGGQRRYSSLHIAIIEEIKKLKGTGLSLEEIKRKLGKESMAEAGNRGTGDLRTESIDLLAEKVAEAVKIEVFRFLMGEVNSDATG